MGVSSAFRSLVDGRKTISLKHFGVPVGLRLSGQLEGRGLSILGLRQVAAGISACFYSGSGDAWVGFVAHGDPLWEVIIGLLWIAVIKAFVEISGLAEWMERYKVGLRIRGLRYS